MKRNRTKLTQNQSNYFTNRSLDGKDRVASTTSQDITKIVLLTVSKKHTSSSSSSHPFSLQ